MSLTRLATVTTKTAASAGSTNFNIGSHTTDTGTDCLLVGVFWSGTTTTTVSTITWNGVSLTTVPSSTATSAGAAKIQWFYLLAPTIQSASTVTITMSAASRGGAVAINYSGVHQTTPFGTAATATSSVNNTTPTVTVTSATGEIVLAGWCSNNGDTTTETTDASISEICNFIGSATAGAVSGREVAGDKAGAASVVMSGTWSTSRAWAISGVSIKPYIAAAPLGKLAYMGATQKVRRCAWW